MVRRMKRELPPRYDGTPRFPERKLDPINDKFGGTPEQVRKYVPNLIAGKTIGMMSLTESGGGSGYRTPQ